MRFLPLLLLLAGCFNPDLSKIRYRCDESNLCPDGQSCAAGLCLRPDELTTFDLAQPAPLPDGSTPPAAAPPCKSGQGYVLDGAPQQTAACPGKFAAGHAAELCAASFGLCLTLTPTEKTACEAINSGFFGSTKRASKQGALPPSCVTNGTHTYIPGCGGRQSAVVAVEQCAPYEKGLDCFSQGAVGWVWQCDGVDALMQASYSGLPGSGAAVDGVLCCKF